MLFQTLAELDALPLYYFRPRYVPHPLNLMRAALSILKKRRFRRYKTYLPVCSSTGLGRWGVRDFRLAIVHSLCFNVFDRLCALTWTSKDDFPEPIVTNVCDAMSASKKDYILFPSGLLNFSYLYVSNPNRSIIKPCTNSRPRWCSTGGLFRVPPGWR